MRRAGTNRRRQVIASSLVNAPTDSRGSILVLFARGHFARMLTDCLSYLALTCAAGFILFAAYSVYLVYSPLPWVDQWVFLQELTANHGQADLALVWKQHNDHRILIPKLFYLIDLYVFHGANLFLLIVIFAFQLLHLCIFALIYRRIGRLEGTSWRFAVALTAAGLFAMRQAENFWFGSDLPVVIPYLCTTAALGWAGMFYMSFTQTQKISWRFLLLTWGAAAAGSLSMTNGFLIWPALTLAMIAWKVPRRVIAWTAGLAAVLAAIWAYGYVMPAGARSHVDLARVAQYILVLYGSSWTVVSERFGMIAAAMALPTTLALYGYVLSRRSRDVFAVVLLSIVAVVMASSLMTAFGRVNMGIEQARSDRYQTGAMMLWCSLTVLAIRQLAAAFRNSTGIIPLQFAFFALVWSAATLAAPVAAGARIHANSARASAIAIEAGVKDSPAIMYVTVPPYSADDLLNVSSLLRLRRWSIFSDETWPLGRQFTRYYTVVPSSRCLGSMEGVVGIPEYRWSGFRITGWAYDVLAKAPAKRVAMTDSMGRLTGFGRGGFPRPDVPIVVRDVTSRETGFRGYVPEDLKSHETRAFAILEDGVSACPLTSAEQAEFNLASATYNGMVPTGRSRYLVLDKTRPILNIERIGGMPVSNALNVKAGQENSISGWIVDSNRRSGSAADVLLDGTPLAAQYGYYRPDVAERLSSQEAVASGFEGRLPALKAGEHTIAVRLVARDRGCYFEGWQIKINATR